MDAHCDGDADRGPTISISLTTHSQLLPRLSVKRRCWVQDRPLETAQQMYLKYGCWLSGFWLAARSMCMFISGMNPYLKLGYEFRYQVVHTTGNP
eukprot:COSAG02_NODE_52749_length_306_cov_0.550725_1_plen_94_part_01